MALIKCKECGREISDKASRCIKCGCPISLNEVKNIDIKTEQKKQVKSNNKSKRNYGFFNGIYEEDIVIIKRNVKKSIIPIFVICFVLVNLLFKTSAIGLKLFFIILLTPGIVFIYMLSLVIKCWYKVANKIETKQASKAILIFISILILAILFTIIFGGGNGDSGNVPTNSELNSCRAQSNTYYRCHWATLENRCVCSRR